MGPWLVLRDYSFAANEERHSIARQDLAAQEAEILRAHCSDELSWIASFLTRDTTSAQFRELVDASGIVALYEPRLQARLGTAETIPFCEDHAGFQLKNLAPKGRRAFLDYLLANTIATTYARPLEVPAASPATADEHSGISGIRRRARRLAQALTTSEVFVSVVPRHLLETTENELARHQRVTYLKSHFFMPFGDGHVFHAALFHLHRVGRDLKFDIGKPTDDVVIGDEQHRVWEQVVNYQMFEAMCELVLEWMNDRQQKKFVQMDLDRSLTVSNNALAFAVVRRLCEAVIERGANNVINELNSPGHEINPFGLRWDDGRSMRRRMLAYFKDDNDVQGSNVINTDVDVFVQNLVTNVKRRRDDYLADDVVDNVLSELLKHDGDLSALDTIELAQLAYQEVKEEFTKLSDNELPLHELKKVKLDAGSQPSMVRDLIVSLVAARFVINWLQDQAREQGVPEDVLIRMIDVAEAAGDEKLDACVWHDVPVRGVTDVRSPASATRTSSTHTTATQDGASGGLLLEHGLP